MMYLIFSILALGSGPLIFFLIRDRSKWQKLIDGFIFITISGLVLLHIFPEAIHQGGWIALLFGVLGLLGPTFSEKVLKHKVHSAHRIALTLGVIGIFLHAAMDGATLAFPGMHHGHGHDHGDHTGELLALAVILHRIPVSLTLWWLIKPDFGRNKAIWVLLALGLATFLGFLMGPSVLENASLAWFQAFVAGSLLHVVIHQHQAHDHHASCCKPKHDESKGSWQAGLGNLLGICLLVFLGRDHNVIGDSHYAEQVRQVFLRMSLDTALPLVLAFVLAGFASVFLSSRTIFWLGKGNTWSQAAKGMAIGLPLPVCSCGTVPLYHSMVKKGAPTAAAMAFFIATPELGLDALLISLPLLGTEMTLIRLVAAALVAFLVGGLVARWVPDFEAEEGEKDTGTDPARSVPFKLRILSSLRQGLVEIVDHTSPWILLGILVAAMLAPFLEPDTLNWLPGPLEVPVFALLGLPVYVCASGATPIVAVFLWNMVSPGAALAFLITGPATNISTFGVLSRLHGKRAAALFGSATLAFSVLAGYIVNWLITDFVPVKPAEILPEEESLTNWISLAVLILLITFSLVKRGARAFLGELVPKIKV